MLYDGLYFGDDSIGPFTAVHEFVHIYNRFYGGPIINGSDLNLAGNARRDEGMAWTVQHYLVALEALGAFEDALVDRSIGAEDTKRAWKRAWTSLQNARNEQGSYPGWSGQIIFNLDRNDLRHTGVQFFGGEAGVLIGPDANELCKRMVTIYNGLDIANTKCLYFSCRSRESAEFFAQYSPFREEIAGREIVPYPPSRSGAR